VDLGARERLVNRSVSREAPALLVRILLLSLFLAMGGCHHGAREVTPESPPDPPSKEVAADNAATEVITEWLPQPVLTDGAIDATDPARVDNTVADGTVTDNAVADGTVTGNAVADNTVADRTETDNASIGLPAAVIPAERPKSGPPAGKAPAKPAYEEAVATERRPKPAIAAPQVAPSAPKASHEASPPWWARSPEELVYRVDFIGITMGYARFRYDGKVSIAGRMAYHLNVRAWTSGALSFIYPINDTIDYYLDAETLAPIRQEYTRTEREKDDVALYNQETGRITYRYRRTGKIRKEVDTIPSVYDPVSVAYYFRWRDLGAEDRPRNVYGGRKLYQISSRVLRTERISTEHGEVDTIVVLPIIRRDGKPDDKGDLKVWFSNDERRVPVRLYAKFRKIKDWTLVGELMPSGAKSGG